MSHQPEENYKIDVDFMTAEAEAGVRGDVCHCFV